MGQCLSSVVVNGADTPDRFQVRAKRRCHTRGGRRSSRRHRRRQDRPATCGPCFAGSLGGTWGPRRWSWCSWRVACHWKICGSSAWLCNNGAWKQAASSCRRHYCCLPACGCRRLSPLPRDAPTSLHPSMAGGCWTWPRRGAVCLPARWRPPASAGAGSHRRRCDAALRSRLAHQAASRSGR